ncbi:hypothetical protein EKI60_03525 [Candidatus Saccharibacteria bacterium]|nr:MAG: hypothetical protein EKI60_03525 [Candidatus Saccharibacteria bacterium]
MQVQGDQQPELLAQICAPFITEAPDTPLRHAVHDLRRNIDPGEELRLRREWATATLTRVALEGDISSVQSVMDFIGTTDVARTFALGINVLERITAQDPEHESATTIKTYLTSLLEDDAQQEPDSRVFTQSDREYLEGSDLDYLDAELDGLDLVPSRFTEPTLGAITAHRRRSGKPRVPLFGNSPFSVGVPEQTQDFGMFTELFRLKKLPPNSRVDLMYDRELLRVAKVLANDRNPQGLISLLDNHTVRTDYAEKYLRYLYDKVLFGMACSKLHVTRGGSREAVLEFIETARPRTPQGAELLQALGQRIGKEAE